MNSIKRTIAITAALLIFSVPALAGTIVVDVNGMVCDFCAQSLKKIFGEQEAVENIDINLDDETVTIITHEEQDISDEKINELIYYAGYDVRAIRRE
jgi:copper chaperone CopZ